MTFSRITPATGPNPHAKTSVERNVPVHEPVTNRALVPIDHAEHISVLRPARPDASFVAHLIAMAEHAPQTRALRRATPAAARAMYDRATVKGADGYGRVFSQIA